MSKHNQYYLAPFHKHSIDFKKHLDKNEGNQRFLGYIDNYKTGKDITTGKNINNEFDTLFIIETIHTDSILDSINSNNNYTTYYILQIFNFYFKIRIKIIYHLLYSISSVLPQKIRAYKNRIKRSINASILSKSAKYFYQYFTPFRVQQTNTLQKYKNIHTGKRCFILGTGPSLNKVCLDNLKNEYTIGVNGIYTIAKEINLDYFIYVSKEYWKHHKEGINNIHCKDLFFPKEFKDELKFKDQTINWLNLDHPVYFKFGNHYKVPFSFSTDINHSFYSGGTVIFLALQLAYYMGFDEVILLGIDHSYHKTNNSKFKKEGGDIYNTKNGDNAHFNKSLTSYNIEYHIDLQSMERGYLLAKKYFEKDNKKIVNASPGTKLHTFEKVDFDSLFHKTR